MDNRFFILSGESSGDVHAANLAKSIKKINPTIELVGWGGDKMRSAGVRITKNLDELAFMGFWEVLSNIDKIRKNFIECKNTIIDLKINTLILVDYPGFNLRIAKWAKERQIKVVYYISPQVWAWKKNRVFKIKKYVDSLYCILPFEKDFYKQFQYDVHYFGHPLLDEIKSFNYDQEFIKRQEKKQVLAILPGSRKQEIEKKIKTMINAALHFKNKYEIFVACAPNIDDSFYNQFKTDSICFVKGKTYELLSVAKIAIVTSGTATLETALFKVPQVICYKSSWLSYQIARKLIKVKYISLVNLILNDKIVEELIQYRFNEKNIIKYLSEIEEGEVKRLDMISSYSNLVQLLGVEGVSDRIANHLIHNQ